VKKTAIILGATGLTGSILLERLIADENYKTIILFSRNKTKFTSPKIKEYIIDLLELEKYASDFIADEVYCCIGTTTAKTKNKATYKSIDYGIPVTAAKLAKQNNSTAFLVMSSMGADAESKLFYNRTKGEMERDVLKEHINNTFILRPSLIGGERTEFRFGEKLGKLIMSVFNPILLGGLKKYKMIHPKKIAMCMHILATNPKKQSIFNSDEIENFSKL
jgi:uncharacterized protein YbjT (DUF2867 family)